jgi:(p)ppGpp synthase/HD superfamily hydrolase
MPDSCSHAYQEAVLKENRKSFQDRLRPVYAPSELNLVSLAYMVAKTVHRGQLRKETDESGQRLRYFEHLRRCTLILIDEMGCRDPVVACEMLLHDSLEDTDLEPVFIEQFFGADVARGVMTLSKQEGETDEAYAARLLSVNDWRPLLGKLCDTIDNGRSLHACSAQKQLDKIHEIEFLRWPIFRKLRDIAPVEYHAGISAGLGNLSRLIADYRKDCTLPQQPQTPPE